MRHGNSSGARIQAIQGTSMAVDTGRKVLLVEDDNSMREAIERLLGAGGYATTVFTSAEALLAEGVDLTAVCVVSDLILPAMSGLELLDRLQVQAGAPPFILITAHDTPGLREEAVRHGAAGYLAKPFRGTELLATVKAVIPLGKPH
jgi:FixJ family two-component response regulator